jgi:beta-galactosidase
MLESIYNDWKTLLLFSSTAIFAILSLRFRRLTKRFKEYRSPNCQGVNRLPSHVELYCFGSGGEARLKVYQSQFSPFNFTFPNKWNFKLFKSFDEALNFITEKNNKSSLSVINVPGNWQLQSTGDFPIYTNIKYVIPVDPPNVPIFNPTGYYCEKFNLPLTWSGRCNILYFGAVDSCIYVWCNGKFVGFSKDSRLPAGNFLPYYILTISSLFLKYRIRYFLSM